MLEALLELVISRRYQNLQKDLPRFEIEMRKDRVHHPLKCGVFPQRGGSLATGSCEGFKGILDSVAFASSCWSGLGLIFSSLGNSSKTPV